ncbi:MAG: hypothetical protein mread185_000001 [Mycoplasmataceae bacterium]|nr:MAG: hypothetical protein mread185_000001 [Mycoplasmataceae bacterium]
MNQKNTQKEIARQKIAEIEAKPEITPQQQRLLIYWQQKLNTEHLSDEEVEKREGESHTKTYQGNQSFTDWEATIDKNQVTHLEIAGSVEDNKLVIQDYPNLKELYALNRQLKTVEINAPKLEILNLSGNKLKELDLTNTPLLENLTVSKNKSLRKIIGLENLNNLEEFYCFECLLINLDCSKNKKLRVLAAANQFFDLSINVQGCDSLEVLDVAENNITNLDCSGLTNLKDVSCKEVFFLKSELSELKDGFSLNADFSGCTSLERLNFSKSNINSLNVNGCRSLKGVIGGWMDEEPDLVDGQEQLMLDAEPVEGGIFIKMADSDCESDDDEIDSDCESDDDEIDSDCESDDDEIENSDEEPKKKKKQTSTKYYLTHDQHKDLLKQIEADPTLLNNYRTVTKTKLVKPERDYETEPWYDPKFWEDKTRFPNLVSLHLDNEKANIYDDPEYGGGIERLQEKRETKELGITNQSSIVNDQEPIITNPSQLKEKNNYRDLLKGKYGRRPEITITNKNLTGIMIIDGFQGYKINVGNNSLSYLLITNCPNLTTLRYAHNKMKHDAWYDPQQFNNPNLTIIDNHNWDGGIEWGNLEENEKGYQEEFNEDLEEDKQSSERKEKINDQVKLLLNRIKNQKNIPFQDFLDIFSGSSMQFVFNSLDQATNDEFGVIFTTRLNNHVEELIANHKQMNKGKLADELEKIMPFWELLSPHLQAQLTRLAKGEQLEVVANQNIWPWIIGLGVIFLLTSTIGYFLIKKLVKWDLNRQINKKAKN